MTNEELQTLIKNACKAAGWPIKKTLHASVVSVWINGSPYVVKLADDDGDSRMLQVACRIDLEFADVNSVPCAVAHSPWDAKGNSQCANETIGNDARLAARMAVLRCAGMIGEAME
jgi:hypothetical protein